MKIFYERTETEDNVILVFKPYYLYMLFGALALEVIKNQFLSLGLQSISGVIWFFVFTLIVVRFISMRKINSELSKAMKVGDISLSGSKFNPKNPLTATIPKSLIHQAND
ncbi:hypothetical protein CWB72_17815 [Pseudoalteromonas phenolica]|uniref:hypothetical protein n=1 Tax=Pseudoalteromonas phenolica TaxID=161398 RepID=UPI00110C156A|nr:hypothetical protein [Pseudoalteromonas phenolica]TMN86844.1 hypothetical protein CWB72_17815 [Pseudoalteromonas phenolica]